MPLNDFRASGPNSSLLCALILLLAAPMTLCRASSAEHLYSLFQTDLPAADIVVLSDASRSMLANHYSEVRQSIIDFAATLTENENLHVRVFGDAVSNPLESAGGEVVSRLEQYLPKEPLFSRTDIGLAISKGLEFLERDGAGEIQAFFLITDGLHQPASGSSYSRDFSSDPDWQALRRRALAACSRRHILVYGFGLGRQTDIAVLRRVFPSENVEMIVGNPSQIVQTLRGARDRLSRTQVRNALEQELSAGTVEAWLEKDNIEIEGASFDATLVIRNGYARLPITLERVEVKRDGDAEKIACVFEDVNAETRIEPAKETAIKIRGELLADHSGFRIGRREQSFQGTFRFAPVARFQHRTAIEQIGVNPDLINSEDSLLTIHMRVRYGVSRWAVAGVVLVLSTAAMILIGKVKQRRLRLDEAARRRIESMHLAGTLKIWRADNDESRADAIDLGQFDQQELALAITDARKLDVVSPREQIRNVVARLSGHLNGSSPIDPAPEFRVAAEAGHRLAYESGGEPREASTLALCDNDLIQLDEWRLRYANHRLRTRAEFESARAGGNDNVR
jgi:hypothetical protein